MGDELEIHWPDPTPEIIEVQDRINEFCFRMAGEYALAVDQAAHDKLIELGWASPAERQVLVDQADAAYSDGYSDGYSRGFEAGSCQ